MKKKSTLIKSLVILLFSVLLVALFGVVPLPEYNTEVNSEISGSIFYMVEIESSNLIPPAPDILDQCIFKINISVEDMNEKKVICSSDLYEYSYNIYLNDTDIDANQNLIIRYWDNSSDVEMALTIDTKNIDIKPSVGSVNSPNRDMYKVNSFGEKLLNSWDMREANTRTAGVYFQKNSEIVEVFNVEAPTNYYFESLVWSPDGQSIAALDTENEIIIFSKSKTFDPIKLNFDSYSSLEFADDEKVIYQIIGWSN